MASSGEGNDGDSFRDHHRYPRSMEGVLQMAIANTPAQEGATQTGAAQTEFNPMDPEVSILARG